MNPVNSSPKRRVRWIGVFGLCGLFTAWGGLGALLVGGDMGLLSAVLAQATGIGAVISLVCGLLHPRRNWTMALVIGGGVFLGLFVLG